MTQDGLGWLFSVLLSGGLIGLGAPFWFKTYRSLASFVPGFKLPDSISSRQKKTGRVSTAQSSGMSAPSFSPSTTITATTFTTPWQISPNADVTDAPTSETPPTSTLTKTSAQHDSGLSDDELLHAFENCTR